MKQFSNPSRMRRYLYREQAKAFLRTTFLVLYLGSSGLHGQTVTRVEPPNWWVDMENDTCQVMLYGSGIGQLEVGLQDYPGVELAAIHRVESPNYVFIDLVIRDSARPGTVSFTLTSAGKKKTEAVPFTLLSRISDPTSRPTISSADVMYLITPDRFANGNPDNDIIAGMKENRVDRQGLLARHGGDIEGIRKHLGYLQDLGISALWINPLMENNMPRASYHGYAITDFYKTDPRFGTNQDYLDLCTEARTKGIKVIMDMVLNHCGSNHWWMADPPDNEWINRYGSPFQMTNHKKTAHSDPYASEEDLSSLVTGWFVESMPDLNTRHPILSKYLIINTIWWIEYSGIAGIRMDTYPYPDKEFMRQWALRIKAEYPGFFTVGEMWHYDPSIVAYWQEGAQNQDGYDSAIPSVFDFPIQGAVHAAFLQEEGWESGLHQLYEMVARDFVYPSPNNLVTFLDNHDMQRIHPALGSDPNRTMQSLAFLLTFRGIPQLYYGTEILMDPGPTHDHGRIRMDFPGGWPGDPHNGFSPDELPDPKQAQCHAWLRRLLDWRRTADVIHTGKLTHYAPEAGTYVFFRHNEEKKIMVIIQKPMPGKSDRIQLARYASMLTGYQRGRDVVTGQVFDLTTVYLDTGLADTPIILELE